jgi:membrane-bound serine protease (ClpP class)
MIIGSLMLFESPSPFLKLSLRLILPAVIVTALFFTLTVRLAYKAFRRKPVTGSEGLIGLEGKALTDVSGKGGTVAVHGEIWSAYSEETIKKEDAVLIVSVSGLKIKVRKKEVA